MPLRSVGSSPCQGHWARRWIDHWVCDAWPVWRQTYCYLPSCRASLPFGRYQIILLGDRGTWVWTTCPVLLLGSGLAGSRTRDLSIMSQRPNHWATQQSTVGLIKRLYLLLCVIWQGHWTWAVWTVWSWFGIMTRKRVTMLLSTPNLWFVFAICLLAEQNCSLYNL